MYEPAQIYEVRQGDGSIQYTTSDPVTPDRPLILRVRVPVGATGPLPVVIVIHGGGFDDVGHTNLPEWGTVLARAGYVAINFNNATDTFSAHCGELGIPASECNAAAFEAEVSAGGTLTSSSFTRPNDASAIVDRLAAIGTAAGVTIDPTRVGVLGHSMGCHAVMGLAGAKIQVSPSVDELPVRDPRFTAYVCASPQGIGHFGFTETSWDPIAVPMLIQTGKNDATDSPPMDRRHAFAHLSGPDAYEQYVDDDAATHAAISLSGTPNIQELTDMERSLAATGIAFLDAYILGRAEARAWLVSDALSDATNGVSTLGVK